MQHSHYVDEEKQEEIYAEFKEKLITRITALRNSENLSARQLSAALGQCESYINKIENRLAVPSLEVFCRICTYFDITPAEFFADGAENPMEYKELVSLYSSLTKENSELLLALARKLYASQDAITKVR